jgi:hypothetical protein
VSQIDSSDITCTAVEHFACRDRWMSHSSTAHNEFGTFAIIVLPGCDLVVKVPKVLPRTEGLTRQYLVRTLYSSGIEVKQFQRRTWNSHQWCRTDTAVRRLQHLQLRAEQFGNIGLLTALRAKHADTHIIPTNGRSFGRVAECLPRAVPAYTPTRDSPRLVPYRCLPEPHVALSYRCWVP